MDLFDYLVGLVVIERDHSVFMANYDLTNERARDHGVNLVLVHVACILLEEVEILHSLPSLSVKHSYCRRSIANHEVRTLALEPSATCRRVLVCVDVLHACPLETESVGYLGLVFLIVNLDIVGVPCEDLLAGADRQQNVLSSDKTKV
jgi:hypothetical protein